MHLITEDASRREFLHQFYDPVDRSRYNVVSICCSLSQAVISWCISRAEVERRNDVENISPGTWDLAQYNPYTTEKFHILNVCSGDVEFLCVPFAEGCE